MPATMNISLPEPLKDFVDGQVQAGGYSGVSDYVRDLIRGHQREIAAQQLRQLIADGVNSGMPIPADRKYWTAKRKKLGA